MIRLCSYQYCRYRVIVVVAVVDVVIIGQRFVDAFVGRDSGGRQETNR